MPKCADAGYVWKSLFEKLETLGCQLGTKEG
jgi:hypothetical protein